MTFDAVIPNPWLSIRVPRCHSDPERSEGEESRSGLHHMVRGGAAA